MYEYTAYEGGPWHKALYMSGKEEDIIATLKLHCVPQTDSFEARTFYEGMRIHSVKFPDGRIWDSYYNDFRPTDKG